MVSSVASAARDEDGETGGGAARFSSAAGKDGSFPRIVFNRGI